MNTTHTYFVYGYKPSHSNLYFYISMGQDPHGNFERDIKQEPNEYGQVAGNKAIHARINYWNKQVRLGIIASTDDQEAAYGIRNFLLYYCQKSVIFKGNQLTKENFVRLKPQVGRWIKNGTVEIHDPLICFKEFNVIQAPTYENWKSTEPVPTDWQVVYNKWVIPEFVVPFTPPEELMGTGDIYLTDGTYWNLHKHALVSEAK